MADLNDSRVDLPRSRARFTAMAVAVTIVLGVLTGRLFQLQVLEGDRSAAQAASARTVEQAIRAPRGLIFDRTGRPLAVNIPVWTLVARPADLPEDASARAWVLLKAARVAGIDASLLRGRLRAYHGSPYDLVPLLRGLTRDEALLVGERAAELPGISIVTDTARQYLDDRGVVDGLLLSHVIGYTGRVASDDVDALAAAGYLPDDVIGRSGVESSFENALRGTYGSQLLERDAAGRVGSVVSTTAEPIPGSNLMLSIDARMQRVATDALRWGMAKLGVTQGVTIVMNPQTGEVLAMVSLPAYDNNKFATGISADDFAAYLADPAQPLRNHAVADIYPPGSTFKLVTGLAALEEGVTTPTRTWPTYGCYQIPGAPDGQCLHEWNLRGFGRLNLVQAYSVSSDTFFYQMAVSLGLDRLAKWASLLGFGARTGIQLPGEAKGIVISRAWAQAQGRSTVYTGELAQAGIGQNVIAVTPLQLLTAYSALANGGRLMRPMIVDGETDALGNLVRRYAPRVNTVLPASEADLQTLRLAARLVITEGHAYGIQSLSLPGQLSGKTGTAQFGTASAGNPLPFHKWFVAWLPSAAGKTDAQLAVVTFTYEALSRGNLSVEITRHFLQAWFADPANSATAAG
jgi:penicillin-binding protein 2